MNWESSTINLGKIKQRSKTNFVFKAIRDLDIKFITVGCQRCTFVQPYDKDKRELRGYYKSETIPKQLSINPGYQQIRKPITITYADGQTEIISYTAQVIK